MAAPTQSLQPFVSLPPPPSQVLIAHFLGFLAADNISIRSQTSRSDAQTIINILTRRIHASFNNITVYGSDKQRLQHYIDTTYAAIYGANVRTIAVDQNIRSDDVQRIISIIGVAVQIFFGQSDALHSRAVKIWPILNLGLPPDAVDPTMVWPDQVTQHASALHNALDVLPRMALKPGLVAVSENHLDHIGNGAALLSQNLGNMYRNFQNAAQAAARNNQVVGSSSTGYNDANPLKLQDQHAGRKNSSAHTKGSTAQSKMISVRPLLDLDVDNINNPLNPDRLQTAKHAIPHSRSTSPVKKKTKKNLSRDDKLKAYKLFVIAERPRLQTEYPNIEGLALSNLLSDIWNIMTAEEKSPFEELHARLMRRERQGTSPDLAKKIEVCQAIPRCQTAVDAKDKYILGQPKPQPPQAHHVTCFAQQPLGKLHTIIDRLEKADPESVRQSALNHAREAVAQHHDTNAMGCEDNDTSKAVKESAVQKITKVVDNNTNKDGSAPAIHHDAPRHPIEAESARARWYENHVAYDEEKARNEAAYKKAASVQDKDRDENMDDVAPGNGDDEML